MIWISRHNFSLIKSGSGYNRTAFFKAREDYTTYAMEIGAQPFDMFLYYDRGEPIQSISARLDGMLAGFTRGDTLILQMPFFIRPINIKYLIEKIQNNYDGKVIAYIHDYEPIRMVSAAKNDTQSDAWQDQFSYKTYDELFPMFDGLIVNSERLKEVLGKRLSYKKPIVVQGPFGYLMNNVGEIARPKYEKKILFAGAFDKAAYLKDIPKEWLVEVFGGRPRNEILEKDNIEYKGSFLPEDLPNYFSGGFGLVWDSQSYPNVTGELGEYTKLSYAHKISLYLAASIPVIIWKKAAGADFIINNNLGFAVDNLEEAWEKISSCTEANYECFQESLSRMSKLIQNGIFTKKAIIEATIAVNCQDGFTYSET